VILTVTLNAALDVTYRVDELRPDASHRVRDVHERAGGKGINVARVLHGQGRDVTCLGLVGGWTGARIAADLDSAGIASSMCSVAGESRRTVSVVSARTGGSTLFNEPGPRIDPLEWQAFLAKYGRFAALASVIVCSGSLPPGVPEDAYGQLALLARQAAAVVIVDADGVALARSLEGAPDVVKPNEAELRAASGQDDPATAMQALRSAGAGAVVATFGAAGMRALTRDGAWSARLERSMAGVNPTGAGDAVAAAISTGLEDGRDWPSILGDAVAWSAAAVAAPFAGDLDPAVLADARSSVRVMAL
jgi:tagatose 6-phosphate kinase